MRGAGTRDPLQKEGRRVAVNRGRLLVLVLGEALVIDVLDPVALDARVAVGLLVDAVLEQLYPHTSLSVPSPLYNDPRDLERMLT